MIILCKSQLDLLRRERLRLQLELLRLPLVMIVQHRHQYLRDQWPENSRSLSIDESHARWGLMSITTAGNGENIPQTGAGKVSPSSSSSSLGQSRPTAGKAKRAAHFAPPALSSEVIIFRDTQTDKHFNNIEVYISIFVGAAAPKFFFFVMQKYSNQGISCKYIQIRVFYAEILVRYRYALPSHERLAIWIGPNQTKLHQNAQLQ